MIGHQQLEQRASHIPNLFGIGGHGHAFFGWPNAGCAQNASASFDHTQAADAYGCFVLLMAQRGNANSLKASRVENGRSVRYGDGLPIDGEMEITHIQISCDLSHRAHAFRTAMLQDVSFHFRPEMFDD